MASDKVTLSLPIYLSLDIFSRMLLFGENLKLFKGISVARRGPKISHLFLADDALLFFNASHQACENSNSLTARFCYISSQQINFQKSLIKFSPNTPILLKHTSQKV